ncbi:MAG: AMP-binding protein [Lachnospiraceae bacterium]|nr:AMP-binding protein [Lachnospiraceae bacterium]
MLIRDVLEESERKFSDITAVRWLKKKEILDRTYHDLMKNVKKIRQGLLAEDFSGKHIALIGNSSVEWIESYLGIITGRNVAVPLDAGLPAEDLVDLINRSDAEGLFLSPKLGKLLDPIISKCQNLKNIWMLQEEKFSLSAELSDEALRKHITVSDLTDFLEEEKQDVNDAERPGENDVATMIFTSGTTGKSKGVILTQNNLATNVEAVEYEGRPGGVLLSVLPIHHAFCLVMDWLKGFSLGTTICINDSLLHMVKNMSVFKPEVMLMVPLMIETIYKRLSGADPQIPKSVLAENVFGGNLHTIFTGGAHLDPFYIDKFEEYGVEVLEGYGMSECSPVISSNTEKVHKKGSIGKPLSNVEISFDNGEILVRGSSVMAGYYKMPEETAETLKDGWLHTGDKGYIDEDGFLFINGRVKNLIILSNGENVSPEEIENKLALGDLVGEVIVTGENNGLTARIYPEQELVQKEELSEEEVRTKLQEFIDTYNKSQPTYRQITGLVVRKNPFIKSSTRKIKRQEVLIDEPVG